MVFEESDRQCKVGYIKHLFRRHGIGAKKTDTAIFFEDMGSTTFKGLGFTGPGAFLQTR